MSSDQETEARAAGKSRCSLRVRMRTEIISAYVSGVFLFVVDCVFNWGFGEFGS